MEISLASKSPVLEADCGIIFDQENPALGLYDCLVARIKEHRKFRILKNDRFSIDDFKAQLKVRRLDEERELRAMPKLIEENQMLRDRN